MPHHEPELPQADNQRKTHLTHWTPEKISRFWDNLSQQPHALANCWSRQVGAALVRYVRRRVGLKGSILDFGCGPGFLIEELLAQVRQASVLAVDSSPDSVNLVRSRFAQRTGFRGGFLSGDSELASSKQTFDVVFFVETIEHLLPEHRAGVLASLLEFLRPGGTIVVTTPNNEILEDSIALCPDCGAVFHRMQHMSSWTAHTLSSLMESCGFRTQDCRPVHLRPRLSIAGWLRDMLVPKSRLPHLIYIGSRPRSHSINIGRGGRLRAD
jgi:2-polyprenyl-3-methyl-5-hydroxy-6-metoxy-1,4-benzoquinol methylase